MQYKMPLPVDLIDVLETITDGFFYVDNAWTVLFWNKSAEEIMGLSREAIIGRNLWEVFPDAMKMDFFTVYHTSKKENHAIDTEISYPSKNLYFHIKTRPYPQGLAVYFKNLTVKKALALEIENTKKHQEALLNASENAIWSVDAQLNLLTANVAYKKRVLEATGINIKPGDYILAGIPSDLQEKRKRYYVRCLEGECYSIEDSVLSIADGSVIYLEINFTPIIDVNGVVTGVACFSKDITERKQYLNALEEANLILAEREQQLQLTAIELDTVLNSSLDLICSTDENGRFVHVNAAFETILGYKVEEIKGRLYTDLLHPDDITKTVSLRNELLNGGKITSFRNRLLKNSGKEIHILWSSHFDSVHNTTFSVGKDASTLVQAELLKEQSEKRFRALIEKGRDMVWLIDEQANLLFVSPNVNKILGYQEEELLHKNSFELIHPDDVLKATTKLKELCTGQEIDSFTIRCKKASGEWRWVELAATNLLDDPIVNGIVVNSRDITERMLEQEQLINTYQRFETVLNITRDVIWEWDLATDKVFKNENHEDLFGYSQEGNDTGQSWIQKVHPDDAARVKDSIMKTIEICDERPWQQEYRYYRADGELAYVIDRGVLIKDKDGKPQRMVGSMQDLTERKKIENERELIIEELTKINNDLKQFSFITSHNLRAPLSNILGLLSLADVEQMSSTNKELFELLRASASQLQKTLQDLSDIIVIRNRIDVARQHVNIATIFDEVQKVYLNTLHDIPFSLHTNFQLNEGFLNKSYLSSIFINLLSNAIKYRSKARALTIFVDVVEDKDGWCRITFKDNGIGLDLPRVKNRLFGMYQKFHDNLDGKGLGLFIVQSQVIAMGGKITVESEIEKGTTFIIRVPIKNAL